MFLKKFPFMETGEDIIPEIRRDAKAKDILLSVTDFFHRV
jgi:hypothetical protein